MNCELPDIQAGFMLFYFFNETFYFIFSFIFISWRLIALQYCSGFCHTLRQAGFRKGRGTRDQIANILWVIKKAREFQKNIYFCFIDYAKAFDYGSQ